MGKRANGEGSVFQRKDGRWQGAITTGYDEKGKQKKKYVYGRTQAEVTRQLQEIRNQLADGTFVIDEITLEAFLKRWLKEKERHVKPSTIDAYRALVENHIVSKIGRSRLNKVTALQVQSMTGELADTVGVRTANASRSLLMSAFKQAIRWRLTSHNPVEATDPLKAAPKDEMRLWSNEEATRFLDTSLPHRLYASFYLAMATGMRRGELLGLRWQDVRGNTIHVCQQLTVVRGEFVFSTPKTDRGSRRIKVTQDVLDVLSEHRKRQAAERRELFADLGLVFTTTVGTPIHPRNFERDWKKLQQATREKWLEDLESLEDTLEASDAVSAKIRKLKSGRLFPTLRLHDLRHMHVSLLVRRGLDPQAIADRVGHSDAAFTLRRYSHMFDEHRERSAISLPELLGSGDPSN